MTIHGAENMAEQRETSAKRLRSEIMRLRTALEQIHDIAAMGTRNTAAWQEILEITNVILTTQGREVP